VKQVGRSEPTAASTDQCVATCIDLERWWLASLWFALCDMHTPKLNTPPDAARVPCSHGRDGPLSNPVVCASVDSCPVQPGVSRMPLTANKARATHAHRACSKASVELVWASPTTNQTHSHCHNLAPFCPNVRARTPFSVPHSFTSAIVERSARLVKLGAVSRGRGGPRTCV
jgi:hypothetical protein